MARLTSKYEYRKNGSRNIKGYLISLPKVELEKNGFNSDTEVSIEIKKNEIIIKKEDKKMNDKRFIVSLYDKEYKEYSGRYECDTEEEIEELCGMVEKGNHSRAKIIDNIDGSITYMD